MRNKLILLSLVALLLGYSDDTSSNVNQDEVPEEIHEVQDDVANVQDMPQAQGEFNTNDYKEWAYGELGQFPQIAALQLYTIADVANDNELYAKYLYLIQQKATLEDFECQHQQQHIKSENPDAQIDVSACNKSEEVKGLQGMMSQYEREDHIKQSLPVIRQMIESANTKVVLPLFHEDNPARSLYGQELQGVPFIEMHKTMSYHHELGSTLFHVELQSPSGNSIHSNILGMSDFKNGNPDAVFPINGISVQNEQEARELDNLLTYGKVYWEGRAFLDFVKSDESNEHLTQNLAHLPNSMSVNLPFVYSAIEIQFFNKETGRAITNKRLLFPHQGENIETFRYIAQ